MPDIPQSADKRSHHKGRSFFVAGDFIQFIPEKENTVITTEKEDKPEIIPVPDFRR